MKKIVISILALLTLAALLCVSVSVIIANLVADMLYSKLDPRIRLE